MLAAMLMASGTAQAQSTVGPVTKPADDSLTMHGVTLYGIVDVGLQYETAGAPFNDYFPAGSNDIVQKDSRSSQFGATPSNMSQSRVGLQGLESLGVDDWYGIFKVETYFNPQSGDIADGLKSVAQNNGRPIATETTGIDTSIAGQMFEQSMVGLSSATYGAITFGRQNTLFADAVAKYDPQGASQAFSLIGLSGVSAGGGDTQDRRLDNSLKYVHTINGVHIGAEYKFNGASGEANTAYELQIGGELAGLSVDAYFIKVRDAISVAPLSAAQVAELPTLGISPDKALAGTISDNTTFALAGLYNFGDVKIYGAYEHAMYANPEQGLPVGFDDIGGYKLAVVNNEAFPSNKILQIYWTGVKYSMTQKLELVASFYGYTQNSYAVGKNAGCSSAEVSAQCSGREVAIGVSADYRFTKRFDVYGGAMYTAVYGGLANGFIYNTTSVDPTVGFRFRF